MPTGFDRAGGNAALNPTFEDCHRSIATNVKMHSRILEAESLTLHITSTF